MRNHKTYIAFAAVSVLAVILSLVALLNGGGKAVVPQERRGGSTVELYPSWYINGLSAGTQGGSAPFAIGANGSTTINATTTIVASFDGFKVYLPFTIATGTAKALWTNTFGPAECSTGYLFASTTSQSILFAPSLVFSLGTSTVSTAYTTNLLASTTVATTTGLLVSTLNSAFILGSGESIIGNISDYMTTGASSTYFGNWKVEAGVNCSLIRG